MDHGGKLRRWGHPRDRGGARRRRRLGRRRVRLRSSRDCGVCGFDLSQPKVDDKGGAPVAGAFDEVDATDWEVLRRFGRLVAVWVIFLVAAIEISGGSIFLR